MSCTATPLWEEAVTEVEESVDLSSGSASEMLPSTIETVETMAEAGVTIPRGIISGMSGPWMVSL